MTEYGLITFKFAVLAGAVFFIVLWLFSRAGSRGAEVVLKNRTGWRSAACIFWLFLIFFFRKGLFNYVMVPGDILYQFYPWKAFAPSHVFHPHNPLLTDIVESVFPWTNLWRDSVFAGEIPLWNMRAYCGAPFAANLVSASFHPFRLLLFVMSPGDAATLLPFLRLFIAAMGMFMLLRVWRVSWHASVAGGFVFAFCGVNIVWLSNYPEINVIMLVPWIFLACDRIARGKKLIWMIFFAVLSFVQFLGGHPETSFHVYVVVFPFFLWQLYRQKSKGVSLKTIGLRSLVFCAGGLLGLLLSSFQLLPFLEYLPLTSRYISIKTGNPFLSLDFFSVFKNITATLFSPDFFGNPVSGNFWGYSNYNEQNVHITVAALFFAFISIFNFRKGPAEKRFFIFVGFASYLVAVRTPFIFDMIVSLPLFKQASNHRLIFFVSFSLALLAAFGIDEIQNTAGIDFMCRGGAAGMLRVRKPEYSDRKSGRKNYGEDRKDQSCSEKYLFTVFFLLIAGAVFFHFISCTGLDAGQMAYRIAVLKRFFLYLILVLCVCFAAKINKSANRFFPFMVICLILVEIMVWAGNYNTFVKKKQLFFSTPLIDFIKSRPGVFRVASLPRALIKGCGLVYGFDSPIGMDPMKTAAFERILSRINHAYNAVDTPGLRYFNSPWLDFLNVKYYVAGPFDNKTAFGRNDLVLVYKGADGKVFKSRRVLPRVFWVKKVIAADSYEQAFYLSVKHEKELGSMAVVEKAEAGSGDYTGHTAGCSLCHDNGACLTSEQYTDIKLMVPAAKNSVQATDDSCKATENTGYEVKNTEYITRRNKQKLNNGEQLVKRDGKEEQGNGHKTQSHGHKVKRDGHKMQSDEPVIKKITEDHILIYVKPSCNARFLVMSMQYYPGWHIETDGRKAALFRVDSAFTGAVIPPGTKKIRLYFYPANFKYGAYLTFAGMLILLCLLFCKYYGNTRGLTETKE